MTSLLVASDNGNLKVVKYLVEEAKADINATTTYGYNALMLAIDNGKKAMVVALVEEYGFDISFKGGDGWTGQKLAREGGNEDIRDYLRGKAQELSIKKLIKAEQPKLTADILAQIPPHISIRDFSDLANIVRDHERRIRNNELILSKITPEQIAEFTAKIEQLDITQKEKDKIIEISLQTRKLLDEQASTLSTLSEVATAYTDSKEEKSAFEQTMQNPKAKEYYLDITRGLNSAYAAALSIDSNLIKHNKVGRVGIMAKLVSVFGKVLPIGGVVAEGFAAALENIDARMQKKKLDRLSNLKSGSIDFDAIAKSVAFELVKQKENRPLNKESANRDIQIMLEATFAGKIFANNNVARSLVKVVTGVDVKLSDPSPVRAHALRRQPVPDKNEFVTKLLAEQGERLSYLERELEKANSKKQIVCCAIL
jgi:hypothetical protein